MCVTCRSNVIITCVKNITALATVSRGVVRGEVLKAYVDFNYFGVGGSKELGLCKANESDRCLFDTTLRTSFIWCWG